MRDKIVFILKRRDNRRYQILNLPSFDNQQSILFDKSVNRTKNNNKKIIYNKKSAKSTEWQLFDRDIQYIFHFANSSLLSLIVVAVVAIQSWRTNVCAWFSFLFADKNKFLETTKCQPEILCINRRRCRMNRDRAVYWGRRRQRLRCKYYENQSHKL